MAEDEESKWWSLTFGGLLSVSAVSMVLLVSTLPVLAGQRSVGRGGQVWVLMEAFWILLAVGVGMAAASWLRPHLERRGRRIALGLALGFALVAVGLVTATALGHRERARARQQEDLRFEDGGPDQIGNKYVPFLEQPMVCDVLDLEDISQRVSTLDPELAAIHVGRELRGICGDVPEPWVGPLLGGLADAADHATPLDERTDQPSLGGPPKLVAGGPIERVLRTWCPTVDEVSARAVSAPASERGYVMYDGCGFGRLGLFEATRPAEIRDVASPLPYGLHLWLLEHGVGVEHARTLTRANLALWASLADPHQHEGVALPRSSSGRHSPEPRPRLELVFDTRSIRRAGEPGRVVELNQGGSPGDARRPHAASGRCSWPAAWSAEPRPKRRSWPMRESLSTR